MKHDYTDWMKRINERELPPTKLFDILERMYGEELAKRKFKDLQEEKDINDRSRKFH